MNKKIAILSLLAFASLALTGDSCILENKDIDVPMRADVDMQFHSEGFNDADTDTVDFVEEFEDIENLDETDITELVDGAIEGGFWRLEMNNDGPTIVTGGVMVTRTATATTVTLIPQQTDVDIDAVGMTFVPAPLDPAGVALINAGFDEFIAWWNTGQVGTPPDLEYIFTWTSSANHGGANFDWEGRLRFTIVGVFSVEIPEVW